MSQEFTAILARDRGKPPETLDRGEYLRTQKELNRAATAEFKARRKMLRALGAAPTNRIPDDGEAVEPDTEQQS